MPTNVCKHSLLLVLFVVPMRFIYIKYLSLLLSFFTLSHPLMREGYRGEREVRGQCHTAKHTVKERLPCFTWWEGTESPASYKIKTCWLFLVGDSWRHWAVQLPFTPSSTWRARIIVVKSDEIIDSYHECLGGRGGLRNCTLGGQVKFFGVILKLQLGSWGAKRIAWGLRNFLSLSLGGLIEIFCVGGSRPLLASHKSALLR